MNSNTDIVVITEHNMKYDEIYRFKLNGYILNFVYARENIKMEK